jgi:exopolysaccharide biosynthesis polyprenyl glycosylphosphotransferase
MLKEQASLVNKLTIIADLVVLVAAFFLAYYVRNVAEVLHPLRYYAWILIVILPGWYVLMARFGLYASMRLYPVEKVLSSLAKVHVIGGICCASLIFLLEPQGFSRALFGYFMLFSFVLLSVEKISLKLFLGYIRRKGYNVRHILIVGTDQKAQKFISLIEQHSKWGLKVTGLLQFTTEEPCPSIKNYKILGKLNELVDICKQNTIDEVVFCVPKETVSNMEEHLRDMVEMGITVRMVLDFYDVIWPRRELNFFHGEIPIITFYCHAFDAGQLFIKRCLDVLGSLAGLILFAVLFPIIAAAIKIDSKGPLFFKQQRVREHGRVFTCWKFRSMYIDAEERKKDLMSRNEMKGAIFKIKDDPRVTRVGKFLRKTSLDELPQFWNVLKGEMSLVGTRPPTPDEVASYKNWHHKRICIKPGLTGMWQVSGRNEIQDFDEVVRLDLKYIDQWTLWLDFKILFKTLWVVFSKKGSS